MGASLWGAAELRKEPWPDAGEDSGEFRKNRLMKAGFGASQPASA